MDRYMLEQVGGWKNAIFAKKETTSIGVHRTDTHISQVSVPNQVNVHFAARFYTWAI